MWTEYFFISVIYCFIIIIYTKFENTYIVSFKMFVQEVKLVPQAVAVVALITLHTLGRVLTVHSFDFTFHPPLPCPSGGA